MNPITRQEQYLAAAAGEYSGSLPTPITREEMYLAKIAEGGGGTSDYTDLENKPQINGVELSGNKTAAQLNVAGLDESGKVPMSILPPAINAAAASANEAAAAANEAVSVIYHDKNFFLSVNDNNSLTLNYDPDAVGE